MTEPAAFKAVFVTCRQVRDEVHFIFAAPAEKGTEYLERIGGFPKPGESRWCAIAWINHLEDKSQREPPSHEMAKLDKPLEPTPPAGVHNNYPRRAGILSSNKGFWTFIEAPGFDKGTFAKHYIKNQLKVESFRDIKPGSEAAVLFDSLELNFKLWENRPRYVETA